MLYAIPKLHVGEPACAAKAAQAPAVATTMSAEEGLRGEEAGRNSSGTASVTPAAAGNTIAEERGTLALSGEEALQGTAVVSEESEGVHAAAEAAPA